MQKITFLIYNNCKIACFRPLTLYKVLKRHKIAPGFSAGMALIFWVCWIALIIAEIVQVSMPKGVHIQGIYSLAWVFYIGFVTVITVARSSIRSVHDINGNIVEDFFAALLAYPCVMIQLETVSEEGGIAPLMPDNTDVDESGFSFDVVSNDNYGESKA